MITRNPFSLEGKTILVTGASSGIGRATALLCAEMGAEVVATGRNIERLAETMAALPAEGDRLHRMLSADLTRDDELQALVEGAGELDGLVLCAGRGLTLPIQFSTREKFDDLMATNFYAPFELLRLLYKKKRLRRGASVVILASLGGTRIFSGGNAIYGVTKAALSSAMKFAAREFAPRLIRVNAVCPGMVDTPLIHRGTVSEEQLAEDCKRYPLKRYGRPDDIAGAVVYLLSDAASWVTGHDLTVDGGVSI